MKNWILAATIVWAVGPGWAADDPLAPAARALAEGEFDHALEQLRRAFDAGYPTPADVYADPRFATLRETPDVRGDWRDLMGGFVRQSEVTVVGSDEAGRPMQVRARVVRAEDGAPVAGARVYLYQTDDTGNYEPDRPVGAGSDPRLFAWVRSDAEGRFVVNTIEPRKYPGPGAPAAHVHYRIEADGYAVARDEFHPFTRPADTSEHTAALRRGRPVSRAREHPDRLVLDVTLPLRTSGDSGGSGVRP